MRAYSEAELLLILVGVLLFIFGSICAYVLFCWDEEVFEDEIIEGENHDEKKSP
jgi:hypothetical protein